MDAHSVVIFERTPIARVREKHASHRAAVRYRRQLELPGMLIACASAFAPISSRTFSTNSKLTGREVLTEPS
jgi:hypothetical protein